MKVHVQADLTAQRNVHSTFEFGGMASVHGQKHSKSHKERAGESNPDTDVFPKFADIVSMWIAMEGLRGEEFLLEYCASDPCIL